MLIDRCSFKAADAACALTRALRVMELGSDFTKESVTLHIFCHVQRTEREATVMTGEVTQ